MSKDASVQNNEDIDTFDIYNPRNPINKRRLEDDKPLQRQKHKRDRTHTRYFIFISFLVKSQLSIN